MGNSPAESQKFEDLVKKLQDDAKNRQPPTQTKRSLSPTAPKQKQSEPMLQRSQSRSYQTRNKSQAFITQHPVHLSPIDQPNRSKSPRSFTPNNYRTTPLPNQFNSNHQVYHQQSKPFVINQNINMRSPTNVSTNRFKINSPPNNITQKQPQFPNYSIHKSPSRPISNFSPFLETSQIYQTKIISDESQAREHPNKTNFKHSQIEIGNRNQDIYKSRPKNISPSNQRQAYSSREPIAYHKSREKSFQEVTPRNYPNYQSNGSNTSSYLKQLRNKAQTAQNEQRKNNKYFPRKTTSKNGQNRFGESDIPYFSMFDPSPRDPVALIPKQGVPSPHYSPKTQIDSHQLFEQKTQNSEKKKEILNSIKKDTVRPTNSFLNNHLLFQKDFQASEQNFNYPNKNVIIDKKESQSSFGFCMSQDSQSELDGEYSGEYHQSFPNMRHGSGRLVFASGGSYQGNFAYGKLDGYGKLFYPSGRLAYEGYWKNNKFNGYGKLFNEIPEYIDKFDYRNFGLIQKINGQEIENGYWKMYQGNLKNDTKEGHGMWILENGEKFDGEFKNDCVHGDGVFYGKDWTIEGRWEYNILVATFRKEDKKYEKA